MGGTVHAETPPDGRGARIVIRLPMEAGATRVRRHEFGFPNSRRGRRTSDPAVPQAQPDGCGLRCRLASTGAQALRLFETLEPAIIILDLGLPDIDGKEVIRRVRETSDVPIIVLSARDREAEKIAALDLGADDYVNKPFGIGELLARIRAVTRQKRSSAPEATAFKLGNVHIDTLARRVVRHGETLHLTPKEFELLVSLARHAGRVMTHHQILSTVCGDLPMVRTRNTCECSSASSARSLRTTRRTPGSS